jgi:(p)ppGpp synthase/HD superfamily hydrolase
MSTLEHAIAIAAKAHTGQVDKAGAPYILHPLRMMLALATNEARRSTYTIRRMNQNS